jgi:hypothetical protein
LCVVFAGFTEYVSANVQGASLLFCLVDWKVSETQQSATDFDANGNLLGLNNIGNLEWHYNNTLNQLTKADKSNTTQYYVYDYQGNRVRTGKMS